MDRELILWTTIQEKILSPSSLGSLSDDMILSFILWYLNVLKGYSVKSITEFTTYHFANMESSDINGNFCGYFEYDNWNLTTMEYILLRFYLKKIRKSNFKESMSCVLYIYELHQLSEYFFKTDHGVTFNMLQQIGTKQVQAVSFRYSSIQIFPFM